MKIDPMMCAFKMDKKAKCYSTAFQEEVYYEQLLSYRLHPPDFTTRSQSRLVNRHIDMVARIKDGNLGEIEDVTASSAVLCT